MARAKQTIADELKALTGEDVDITAYTAEQLEQMVTEAQQTPATAPAGYGEPDDNGHRWKIEAVGKQVRVRVLTHTGQEYNTLAESESAGRDALAAHIAARPH